VPHVGKARVLWYDVACVESRELGLIRRWVLSGTIKEAALGIRMVARDVEWTLRGLELGDNSQALVVRSTLGLFSILKRDPNLVTWWSQKTVMSIR